VNDGEEVGEELVNFVGREAVEKPGGHAENEKLFNRPHRCKPQRIEGGCQHRFGMTVNTGMVFNPQGGTVIKLASMRPEKLARIGNLLAGIGFAGGALWFELTLIRELHGTWSDALLLAGALPGAVYTGAWCAVPGGLLMVVAWRRGARR
jgi:hypothetical protein